MLYYRFRERNHHELRDLKLYIAFFMYHLAVESWFGGPRNFLEKVSEEPMGKSRAKNRLVYSTEGPVNDPAEDQSSGSQTTSGTLYIKREVKGRGGKTVTTINCTHWPEEKIKELATELKKFCGSGGSVKEGIIILQGDQRQKIRPLLTGKGYQVKLAGG